ncbi:ATP-dependent protease La [Neoconidiobolus thromboides FSU 785]|nr:ATP-dependent protease La [Neoconidiobolus thromboides FSU 785]
MTILPLNFLRGSLNGNLKRLSQSLLNTPSHNAINNLFTVAGKNKGEINQITKPIDSTLILSLTLKRTFFNSVITREKDNDDKDDKKNIKIDEEKEDSKESEAKEDKEETEVKEKSEEKKEDLKKEKEEKNKEEKDDKDQDPINIIKKAVSVIDSGIQKPSVPEVYPQLLSIPITRRPLFPGFYKAVVVKNPDVISAIKELMKRGQPYISAFLLKDDNLDIDTIENMDQVYNVGVFAQITSIFPSTSGEENSLTAVLYPHRRIRMSSVINDPVVEKENKEESNKPIEASFETEVDNEDENATIQSSLLRGKYAVSISNVENIQDEPCNKKNPMVRAITTEMVSAFKDIAALNSFFRDQIANFSVAQYAGNVFDEPGKLADFAAAMSSGESKEIQEVLESLVIEERLQKSLVLLKKELVNAQLQSKISKDVDAKIAKRQREYYLMEQLKGIKSELGLESDGKDKLVEQFKEKANELNMPDDVRKVFDEELIKLNHLEPASSEFNVTRNYLDWLTVIPWGKRGPENYDLKNAIKVLDEDHYGLKDVKDRILEFIAVGKLRGTVEGKIICLAGPPGVGKTSIGKSIARALGREFYRFSVGGLTDVAEIKGHRRTYVGAMPGKVVQALKKVQTENPLILIDEVDKIGRGHQGDPSSALLELLDPEQNSSFLDHYMDVHIDLSRVLFVCTANVIDTIPGPLLDRMEVIQLSGYIADEKAAIASKYLAPQAKEACGLENVQVDLQLDTIEAIIKNYCRESGVRNLKKFIEKIYRKVAFKLVKEHEAKEPVPPATEEPTKRKRKSKKNQEVLKLDVSDASVTITPDCLKEYVGPPIFTSDRLYETTPPGVVMGLAWTSMGGSSLYIESVLESALNSESKPGFTRTGQLGDVMKESSTIAYTFSRSYLARKFPNNHFFDKASVHLHVPEGATPKDGPSAGITMTTSLVSLALDKPIAPTVAMTGEITLTGKVLKIGGLKEKTIAAKRSGVTTIICPGANKPDWEELEDYIREGLTCHFVEWFDEIPPILELTTDNRKPIPVKND